MSPDQLTALLDSIQRLHALYPDDFDSNLRDSWFHQFDFGWYLDDLEGFMEKYGAWLATTEPDGPELRARLTRLIEGYAEIIAATSVDPGRENVAVCLPARCVTI